MCGEQPSQSAHCFAVLPARRRAARSSTPIIFERTSSACVFDTMVSLHEREILALLYHKMALGTTSPVDTVDPVCDNAQRVRTSASVEAVAVKDEG